MQNENLKEESVAIRNSVTAITVSSQAELILVGEKIKFIKVKMKEIEDKFAEPVKKAYEAHKSIVAFKNEVLKPLQEAENFLRDKINFYLTEQEKVRVIEQRRLEAEAKAAADKEKARLEKLAENAQNRGNEAKAEEFKSKAQEIYAEPVFTVSAPKTVKSENATISVIKDIEIQIINQKEFLKYAVDNLPEAIIKIDMAKLKMFLKNMKIVSCPGLTITNLTKSNIR